MMTSRCRACGAELGWALTEANAKPMPLDPHPSSKGNVALRRGEAGGSVVAYAQVLAGAELEAVRAEGEVPLFVPHFATCPGWPARAGRRQRGRRKATANVVELAERRTR